MDRVNQFWYVPPTAWVADVQLATCNFFCIFLFLHGFCICFSLHTSVLCRFHESRTGDLFVTTFGSLRDTNVRFGRDEDKTK